MTRILDLSVLVDRSTQAPPAAKGRPVGITHHRRGPGHWQVSSVDMLLHTGSHVDSTWHVFEDGDPIAATPLERVIGEAALIDFTSEDFVVHRKLLGAGLPLVEQATNLASVGQERFTIHAPFFRLDAAEAAPCRVFAFLDT